MVNVQPVESRMDRYTCRNQLPQNVPMRQLRRACPLLERMSRIRTAQDACIDCIIKQKQIPQRRDEAATRGLKCRHQADCARRQPLTSSSALDGIHPLTRSPPTFLFRFASEDQPQIQVNGDRHVKYIVAVVPICPHDLQRSCACDRVDRLRTALHPSREI